MGIHVILKSSTIQFEFIFFAINLARIVQSSSLYLPITSYISRGLHIYNRHIDISAEMSLRSRFVLLRCIFYVNWKTKFASIRINFAINLGYVPSNLRIFGLVSLEQLACCRPHSICYSDLLWVSALHALFSVKSVKRRNDLQSMDRNFFDNITSTRSVNLRKYKILQPLWKRKRPCIISPCQFISMPKLSSLSSPDNLLHGHFYTLLQQYRTSELGTIRI